MPEIDVKDLSGRTVGKLALPDGVFAAPVKRHLLHEAVRNYRAGGRSGTHDTKNRTEVEGGGKKPWKQKHTGRARHGSTRSPLWRKGGTVQGPTPRDYSYALPKQVRRGALRSALSLRAKSDKLVILEDLELPAPKSKELLDLLEGTLGIGPKVLIVHEGSGSNLDLAARNLENVQCVRTLAINVYDILKHDYLLVSRAAAERIAEVLAR